MKNLLFLTLFIPCLSHASFIFQYGVNYSKSKDSTTTHGYDSAKMFHKVYLGGAINGPKTVFIGWNINSWTADLKQNTTENNYKLTEMGPRLMWFLTEDYNIYTSLEWNPYAKGTREIAGAKRDITGSSMDIGIGYRFRVSRLVGMGASLHYHSLSLKKETQNSTESTVSDSFSNIMPMLELTLITR